MYQFGIIHRPDKNNEVADALSRREYDTHESESEIPCIATVAFDTS